MYRRTPRPTNYYVLHDFQGQYLARTTRNQPSDAVPLTRNLSAAWFTLDSTTAYEMAYLLDMRVQRLVSYE